MYHTMHELREFIKKQDWNTIKTHQNGWSTPHIIVVLTSITVPDQVKLFRTLDTDRAIDIFKRLKLGEQHQLLKALGRNEATKLIDELDPNLRAQLADIIPAKTNRRLFNPTKLQAVWSIFA